MSRDLTVLHIWFAPGKIPQQGRQRTSACINEKAKNISQVVIIVIIVVIIVVVAIML